MPGDFKLLRLLAVTNLSLKWNKECNEKRPLSWQQKVHAVATCP